MTQNEYEKKVKREEWLKSMERQAYHGSHSSSDYGSKHNMLERLKALMKQDKPGNCLYCNRKMPNENSYAEECREAIKELFWETKLPAKAKDRNNYDVEGKKIPIKTLQREDGYGGGLRETTVFTREKKVKKYKLITTERLRLVLFPKLEGTVCKSCSDEFTRKVARCLKQLRRHRYKEDDFADKIQKSVVQCHECYMKQFESMLEKRGY
ncbi:MAG: hypothetical protein FK733_11010 [Asgard group archaeon]|nr:hypothetical protein [Asgard group archaeon]